MSNLIDSPPALPPGRMGLPVLGETLSYVKNGFAFIDQRLAAHGKIFKTRLLGRDTVVIAGTQASAKLIDPRFLVRSGSMPPHVQAIFGGKSLPLLDAEEHLARKTLVLEGFTREAIASFLPGLEKVISTALLRWELNGEFPLIGELRRLALEGICANAFGMQPGPEMDRLLANYGLAAAGIASVPLRLPGTAFSRALRAVDDIMAVLASAVSERRAKPGQDALSRMLAARTPEGKILSDDEARLELHHIVVAGFIIYAEFAAAVIQLSRHPEVLARVREEIQINASSGPLTAKMLASLPYTRMVIMEIKRLCPVLPAVFAKARAHFEFEGFKVPAGWMVLWAWWANNRDASVYAEAERFNPERFAPGREEHKRHEHAFTPHGPGAPLTSHTCPGADYASVFMTSFLILILRSYSWELPKQDLGYNWSMTPPEPRDGLRIRLRRA